MGIKITDSGHFEKTRAYLNKLKGGDIFAALNKYGAMGAAALSAATPVEGGETAQAWTYEIVNRRGYYSIRWVNTHRVGGVPLVILLQYGHGTGTGGYVQGRDFINPAIKPIFDQIDAELGRVVSG